MMTNYVIASTTRFKAATSGAGISNALTGYGTDQYVREYEQELGTPWKNLDNYLRVSFPFLHADRIATPTLFLCGDEDFNVPLVNSEQMYQALRSLGVPDRARHLPGPAPRDPQAELPARPPRALRRVVRPLREVRQGRGRRGGGRGGELTGPEPMTPAEWKRKAVHAGMGLFALALRWLDWRRRGGVRGRSARLQRLGHAADRPRPLPRRLSGATTRASSRTRRWSCC